MNFTKTVFSYAQYDTHISTDYLCNRLIVVKKKMAENTSVETVVIKPKWLIILDWTVCADGQKRIGTERKRERRNCSSWWCHQYKWRRSVSHRQRKTLIRETNNFVKNQIHIMWIIFASKYKRQYSICGDSIRCIYIPIVTTSLTQWSWVCSTLRRW